MTEQSSGVLLLRTSGGYETLISAEDGDLADEKWQQVINRDGNAYVARDRCKIRIHRVIMSRVLGRSLSPNEVVDHINGNTLDNTRGNLRLATTAQNLWNRKVSKRNKSGATGVFWMPRFSKWGAHIYVNGKRIWLGYYDEYRDAVSARRDGELKHLGEFAPSLSRQEPS